MCLKVMQFHVAPWVDSMVFMQQCYAVMLCNNFSIFTVIAAGLMIALRAVHPSVLLCVPMSMSHRALALFKMSIRHFQRVPRNWLRFV